MLAQFLVTADLGLEGTYAVDLRLSHPVSKAVLVGQQRRSAFAEPDLSLLAERLAAKTGRASLHDVIGTSLARALGDLVKTGRKDGSWDPSCVEQFRVGITSGTRLQPRSFYLLAIAESDPAADLVKTISKCVGTWKRASRAVLRAEAIAVEAPKVRSVNSVSVPVYRATAHLPVPDLSHRLWL